VNAATLHYEENSKTLKQGDLMLMDMGIRFAGYSSDVTCTIPVSGKFTEDQANIYQIVLDANREVIKNLKPGVYWPDMQLLAEKVIIRGLIKMGLLNGSEEYVEQMLKDRVAYYFMPHGLGHFMGIDVHDVGGYLSFTPKRRQEPGLASLRTARYLAANNVITVEPGIYFIPVLLDKAFADDNIKKYFNEKIKSFYNFGGVRIEDDVLITIDGALNMTQDIPRDVKELEALLARRNK
jgi:Xaa-Pro dipeptidase